MNMTIAVDFDGTVVKHAFPQVGEDIGAVPVLKALVKDGHKIVLNTMRSGKLTRGINTLDEAVKWFEDNDIPLYGVNHNPDQDGWTASPKVFAHLFIDDAALGCPVKSDNDGTRPYVDWVKVARMLGYNYETL